MAGKCYICSTKLKSGRVNREPCSVAYDASTSVDVCRRCFEQHNLAEQHERARRQLRCRVDWAFDGRQGDEGPLPPSVVVVELPVPCAELYKQDDWTTVVLDALSDQYGWLVEAFWIDEDGDVILDMVAETYDQ